MRNREGFIDQAKTYLILSLGLMISVVLFYGCSDDDNGTEPEQRSIRQILLSDSRFSFLSQALENAQVLDTLDSEGPYTIFAPVNSAFTALGMSAIDSLLEQSEAQLRSLLEYHIASGSLRLSDLGDQSTIETLQGDEIEVRIEGNTIFLNDSVEVVEADILASNGVIHAIGGILTP